MEASLSAWNCNSIVREPLDDNNYEIWSSCMKDYLFGQDLWDIIEPEDEPADQESGQSSSDSKKNSIKRWRRKNALALHAIKLSCGPKLVFKVVNVNFARQAWILLQAAGKAAGREEELPTTSRNGIKEEDDGTDQITRDSSINEDQEEHDEIAYEPLVKAVKNKNWSRIYDFIYRNREALTARVIFGGRTVLHYALYDGQEYYALRFARMMRANDFKLTDENGYTALAVGAFKRFPGQVLKLFVLKDPNLPNIGTPSTLPVILASSKGFKDIARYLYSVTNTNLLNPEVDEKGVTLLVHCIENKIFDIAMDLVEKFPKILNQRDVRGIYPLQALAKTFSTFKSRSQQTKSSMLILRTPNLFGRYNGHIANSGSCRLLGQLILRTLNLFGPYIGLIANSRPGRLLGLQNIPTVFEEFFIHQEARSFLLLVCKHVATLGIETLIDAVYGAMVEAAIRGNIEFISEMLSANPDLIWAHHKDGSMFVHAIKNRRVKVFNLLYAVLDEKDRLLNCVNNEKNNILHLAAMLPPSHILDRASGPALQVQKEFQWFQEVWNVADPHEREELNNGGLTPRELFAKSHEKLIDAGEKSMKAAAQSSTVVGALIVTIMFAATFTVPGGNDQSTGYPLLANEPLFKIFIICDALSLFSSASSVLIFLGILTSGYAEDDFLLLLPRKLMLGIATLFFSIATMMVTFCATLAIMLNGRWQFILPIELLAFVPVILFLSSIFPLLSKIYMSTFGPSIFDKNTKLPSKEEYEEIRRNPSSAAEDPNNEEGENRTSDSTHVEEIVNSSGDQLV